MSALAAATRLLTPAAADMRDAEKGITTDEADEEGSRGDESPCAMDPAAAPVIPDMDEGMDDDDEEAGCKS